MKLIVPNYPNGSYHWSTGDNSAQASINKSGIYHLTFTDGSCHIYDSIKVSLSDELDILIPNVFSPNSDNINEYWMISTENGINNSVKLFNRWGITVYQNSNYNGRWNGSGLEDGFYYYEVETSKEQCKKTSNGWLQLIR
jgi:gliding motility-associated-like protein